MQNLMPPIDTPDNLFHDGDPTQGIEGTIVTSKFLNNDQSATRDTQQEIINVLSAVDIEPDPDKQDQLLEAINKLAGAATDGYLKVGDFGLGGGSNHKDDAYNNVGEIYRVNNTSANAPAAGVTGVVSLPCDGGPSTAYVAVSNAGAAWVGSSTIPTNGVRWNRVYTTAYKPTAADVDAVAKTGDRMSGPLGSTYSDTYRIAAGRYGTFWRNDGNNLYLMLTNADDQWGGFNDLRPLTVNTSSGSVTIGTQLSFDNPNFIKKTGISSYQSSGINHNQTNGFILQGVGEQSAESHFLETVGVRTALRWRIRGGGLDAWPEFRNDGSLYLAGNWPVIQTSSGATFHPDANIEGTLWGGYLSNWLNRELTARDNNINTRATWDYVNQNFIQNVRYTAETQHGATGIYTYHENTVLTGFNNWDGDYSAEELFWSYIQIYKNGQWLTIGR
jgi:hypothetical protein